MKLPSPPPQYSQNDQAQTRRLITDADAQNAKLPQAVIWTPADGSGQSLTLTVNRAICRRFGDLVFVQASITWPTTADTHNASISGLPFGVPANGGCAAVTDNGFTLQFAAGGSAINILTTAFGNNSLVHATNANLSTLTINFSATYPAV